MGISEIKNIFSEKFNSLFTIDKLSLKLENYKKELYMSNDLLFSLTYMASISTANLTRDRIFTSISEKKNIVQVHILIKSENWLRTGIMIMPMHVNSDPKK